jgi:hypothetical protein
MLAPLISNEPCYTNMGCLKLITMSIKLKEVTFGLHTISRH